MTRLAVVGAGIAGLTCAYRLHRLDPAAEIVVYEASAHVGGKVRTTDVAGVPVDEAADAFLARVPAAVELCRELGLEPHLVTPSARRAFVYRGGALHPFPEGLVLGVPTDLDALAASGIVSAEAVARAGQDLTMPATVDTGDDTTVGALVRSRVGDEVFEALVAPLLSGVHAGDADRLSVAAGAPQFAAAVRDQPSLIEGLRQQRAQSTIAPDAPVFYGLRGGTQSLTDALAAALPAGAVATEHRVTALVPHKGGGFRLCIETPGGAVEDPCDAVVLAVPSFSAASLVAPFAPDLGASLDTLTWASVVLVTLAVRRRDIAHALDGSGFLVSEDEGRLMTACSFGSSKWAHWAHDDLVILRISAGRAQDGRAWELDDDDLVAALRGELADIIGLSGHPTAIRVSRWARALPQYRPGHLDRARQWKEAAARHGGLFLTGASCFGLGLPACITDADATARAIVGVPAP